MKTIAQWIKYICKRPDSETEGEKHYSVARSELGHIAQDAYEAGKSSANSGKLKLYVWTDFCPDYTEGLACAVAPNVEEAKKLVLKSMKFPLAVWELPRESDWGTLHVLPLNASTAPVAFAVSGGG